MDFLDKEILEYCEKFTSKKDRILEELTRETEYKILMPRMMSSHIMGSFLQFISYMIKPMYILEIGTYTGYSAICLAKGLQQDGHLHTIEINPEHENFSKKYFKKAKVDKKITQHIGHALEVIPSIDIYFDIIFIDADKKNYLEYYKLALNKIKKGGIIIIDNVLWSGKVLQKTKKNDQETSVIKQLNKVIMDDSRVENMILPLRDGIMMCKIL